MPQEERTLVIVKPDAVQRGLIGKILCRFEERGLKVAAGKFVRLSMQKAEELYAPHKGKGFYDNLTKFITSGPVMALVLEGPQVIKQVRTMMGSTNCLEAQPGTIRGDFGLSIQNNLIHGSDSPENAKREIAVFFAQQDICEYSKAEEEWVMV